jgi:predicted metal-dependent phosphoesterase TrpH
MSRPLRVDLHAHTWYSADSLTSPERLVEQARARGLDRIAITDHGTIAGARAARALDAELVIVGEEIRCKGGVDVIGLFIRDHVPNGLPLTVTARLIKAQGGIVYAPHPYAYILNPSKRARSLASVADILEVFNARAFYAPWNRRADALASETGIAKGVGSDAHMPWEIGRVFNEVAPFADGPSLVAALEKAGRPSTQPTNAMIHFLSFGLHAARALVGRSHGVPLRNGPKLTERASD